MSLVEETLRGRPRAYLEAADVQNLLDLLSRPVILRIEYCLLTAVRELRYGTRNAMAANTGYSSCTARS